MGKLNDLHIQVHVMFLRAKVYFGETEPGIK